MAELDAYSIPRLDECEGQSVNGDEVMRSRRYQRQTGWRGWPHRIDIVRAHYPHGVPDADTAGVVAVLDDDGAVAGHSFYVQVPFCH